MKRTLSLSLLALATVASVATSLPEGHSLGMLEAQPLESGALQIQTGGPAGAGFIEAVQVSIALELAVDDGRRLDAPALLRVRMDDGGEEPIEELIPLAGPAVEHTVEFSSWELLQDCPDYPSCTDVLFLGFDVVDEGGTVLEKVGVDGDMAVFVAVTTSPEDGDTSAGVVETTELTWLTEIQ